MIFKAHFRPKFRGDIISNGNNNYIFIVLNGNKEELVQAFRDRDMQIKPKKVFVISQETVKRYFNDLPKLLPCIDKWDSDVNNLFKRLKSETREFFLHAI